MRKPFFLAFILIFFTSSFVAKAQKLAIADSLFSVSLFSKAEDHYLEVRTNSIIEGDWETLAYCNIKLADIIRINGGNRLALKLLEENDSIITQKTSDPLLVTKNLIAKAEAYYNLSELAIFKTLVDSSYTIKLNIFGEDDPQLAEELMHKGRYNLRVANYNKMREFAFLAREKIIDKKDRQLTRILNLIGYSYHTVQKFDSALLYYDSALYTLKYQQRNDLKTYAMLYRNIGNSYNDLINYNDDKEKYRSLAFDYYDKEIEVSKSFASKPDLAVVCFVKYFAYRRLGNTDSSLYWINQGIKILAPKVATISSLDIQSLENTLDNSLFLLLISTKARVLIELYDTTGDSNYLIESTKYLKYRLLFHQFLVSNSTSDFEIIRMYSLFDWDIIGGYTKYIYELNRNNPNSKNLYEAFELVSMNKYGITFKNLIKEYSYQKSDGYVNYLLEEEFNELKGKTKIIELLQKFVNTSKNGKTTSVINSIDNKLLFAPLYKHLKSNDAIIDYNQSGKNLLTYVITKDTITLTKTLLNDSLESKLKLLKTVMHNGDVAEYQLISREIFENLVEPIYPLRKEKLDYCARSKARVNSL